MPYTCQCCFKTYTNKSWYDKHIVWCTDTPHNTKIALEELGDVPPPLIMYKMILDLSTKVQHLEQKCYELAKNQKKEKDLIPQPPEIEFNKKPQILFKEWYDGIEISSEKLDLILKTSIDEQFVEILQDLVTVKNEEILPFITDIQHKTIHIYEFECDGWVRIKRENFSKLIDSMLNKTQNLFNRNYNTHEIKPSSSEFDDYVHNVEKIMSANKNRIMNNVYKSLIGK